VQVTSLAVKFKNYIKVTETDKRSSLLWYRIKYDCKKFYRIVHKSMSISQVSSFQLASGLFNDGAAFVTTMSWEGKWSFFELFLHYCGVEVRLHVPFCSPIKHSAAFSTGIIVWKMSLFGLSSEQLLNKTAGFVTMRSHIKIMVTFWDFLQYCIFKSHLHAPTLQSNAIWTWIMGSNWVSLFCFFNARAISYWKKMAKCF